MLRESLKSTRGEKRGGDRMLRRLYYPRWLYCQAERTISLLLASFKRAEIDCVKITGARRKKREEKIESKEDHMAGMRAKCTLRRLSVHSTRLWRLCVRNWFPVYSSRTPTTGNVRGAYRCIGWRLASKLFVTRSDDDGFADTLDQQTSRR